MRSSMMIVSVSAAMALCGAAQAAVVASYDADSQTPAPDPTFASGGPWVASGVSHANTTVLAGEEPDGRNYWEINDDNSDGNSSKLYSFNLTDAQLTDPTGWTATAVVRVLEASNTESGVLLEVRNGVNLFNLGLVHDGANEFLGHSTQGTVNTPFTILQSMDVHSDYNTYQMYYSGSGNEVDVYVNGDFASTVVGGNSTLSRIAWGSNVSSATGVSRWSQVRFETGFAVVPEPASLGLLSLAGLGLLGRRTGRRA